MSTDPPPITQHDGVVTIQGAPALAAAYRATLAGIARRRADGLPASDLQQLARALRRAHIAAMSPQRHPLAKTPPGGSRSSGQDGALIDSVAVARLLSVSRRTVQRLAEHDADLVGARRFGSIWLFRRDAVLALAEQRKAAK